MVTNSSISKDIKEREHLIPYLKKAKNLAWITIGYLIFDVTLLILVSQNSQAMKAAWIEDLLYFIPSISFLVATGFVTKPANKRFRYGYDRAYTVGFIISSFALLAIGVYVLVESLIKLVNHEVVTIGTINVFGETIWFGWIMIMAIGYSITPVYLIGSRKIKLAKKLNLQILSTDAKGQRADWLTSVATIVGLLGVGYGLWWADAMAAIVIAVDIVLDGFRSIRAALSEAMDRTPLDPMLHQEENLLNKVEKLVQEKDWISDSFVRLRNAGNKTTGEVLLILKSPENLEQNLYDLRREINEIHWQLMDVSAFPVKELPPVYNKKI